MRGHPGSSTREIEVAGVFGPVAFVPYEELSCIHPGIGSGGPQPQQHTSSKDATLALNWFSRAETPRQRFPKGYMMTSLST